MNDIATFNRRHGIRRLGDNLTEAQRLLETIGDRPHFDTLCELSRLVGAMTYNYELAAGDHTEQVPA